MDRFKVDLAVVGSGAAGMSAALTASENGASVSILEKRSVSGGFSNIPIGGILCVDSRCQREKNYPVTGEQLFRALMDFGHWSGNARLLKAFLDKTADTVDWLEKQGVEFDELPAAPPPAVYSGGLFAQLHIKGHAFSLMKTLRARARERGIVTHLKTTAKKITLQDGHVTGIIAEDRNGNEFYLEAGTVVIATGGFSANKEMIKQLTGFTLGEDIFTLVDIGHNGDGIRIAWEAGAVSDNTGMHLYYGVPELLIPRTQLHIISMQPYLWLNQQGERFIDETLGNPAYISNALARQPDRCAYLVFDANTKKHMEENGPDNKSPWLKVEKIADIGEQIQAAREKGNRNLFMCSSLEELAAATGMNKHRMLRSIEEYNDFCSRGQDAMFYKKRLFLHPVKTPGFYAFRIRLGCHGTLGGIKINERAEALNKLDEPIPGLYAAGYDACNIYGNPPDYNWLVPGGALSFALNSGRIAGENAFSYLSTILK